MTPGTSDDRPTRRRKWTKWTPRRFSPFLVGSILLLTAACQQPETPPEDGAKAAMDAIVSYAGAGRDRLCLAPNGGVAGLITFAAQGEGNCSLRGSFGSASDPRIRPNGDESCAIPVRIEGDRVTLGAAGPGCAYYCGPGASLEGKTFVRMDKPAEVTDLGGDPLC